MAITYISLTLIFIVLCVNVFIRYLELGSFNFGAEVPEVVFPWLVAACVGLAALHGAHISVTLMLDRLSPAAQRWVGAVLSLITIVLYVLALYVVIDLLPIVKDDKSPILKISLGWTYLAMGFAFITIIVAQCASFFKLWGYASTDAEAGSAS
jgi:TRAP-type transport system small permease protein